MCLSCLFWGFFVGVFWFCFQGTSSQKQLQRHRLYVSDVAVSRSWSAPLCVCPRCCCHLILLLLAVEGGPNTYFIHFFFFFWKSWFHCLADLIDRIKSLIIFFFSSSECHFSTRIKMHLSQQSLPQLAARAGHRLPESRRCRSRGAAWEGCEGVVASGSSALALRVLSFPSKLISRCR